MRKAFFLFFLILIFFLSCDNKEETLYTIGVFQFNDAPTLNIARKAFQNALEENGFFDGRNIRIIFKNGGEDIPEVQRIAQDFVSQRVDMIVAFSTSCLQSAINATQKIPIVFSNVANPYLAGAGQSKDVHLSNVSGVSSRGPIKQGIAFIKEVLPGVKRIGTLWTPSELNSEFYLEVVRTSARELGLEIIAVPITNSSEVILSTQALINRKIDVLFPVSDNTINASFEALGQIAEENTIPLFGGFLLSVNMGACAAVGWDFYDMGYKAGEIAIRIKNGENPKSISFQEMNRVRIYLNLNYAKKQGIEFSEDSLKKAYKIIEPESNLDSIKLPYY